MNIDDYEKTSTLVKTLFLIAGFVIGFAVNGIYNEVWAAELIHQDDYATIYHVSDDPDVIQRECEKIMGEGLYNGCVSWQPDPDTYYWENKVIASVYAADGFWDNQDTYCHEVAHVYGWQHSDGNWEDWPDKRFQATECGK